MKKIRFEKSVNSVYRLPEAFHDEDLNLAQIHPDGAVHVVRTSNSEHNNVVEYPRLLKVVRSMRQGQRIVRVDWRPGKESTTWYFGHSVQRLSPADACISVFDLLEVWHKTSMRYFHYPLTPKEMEESRLHFDIRHVSLRTAYEGIEGMVDTKVYALQHVYIFVGQLMVKSLGFPYMGMPEAEIALQEQRYLDAAMMAWDEQFLYVATSLCSRDPLIVRISMQWLESSVWKPS